MSPRVARHLYRNATQSSAPTVCRRHCDFRNVNPRRSVDVLRGHGTWARPPCQTLSVRFGRSSAVGRAWHPQVAHWG